MADKWCTACKVHHPVKAFGSDRSRGDGLAASCRLSRHRGTAERPGSVTRLERRAIGQAWCRGCLRWLPENEVNQGACREHRNAYYRARYAVNPEHIRLAARARKRGLAVIPSWWVQDHRDDFDGMCAYGCGREPDGWDHVWPVSRGGQSVPGNLVPACSTCNSRKKNNDPTPWVDRGLAAFPTEWSELIALASEHLTNEWLVTV